MNIYVGNLSSETTEDELRQAFESFGQVSSVKIMRNRASGESVGFGFVGMPESEEGQAAIGGLNGKDLGGSTIKVEEGRAKTSFAPASTGRGGGRDSGAAVEGGVLPSRAPRPEPRLSNHPPATAAPRRPLLPPRPSHDGFPHAQRDRPSPQAPPYP